jgi:MATE family multidrug resistance protein
MTPPFPTRQFIRLSAFNVLSNLMVPLASLCDVAFLGHLDTLAPLAGVALAGVLFSYLYWSFGFLRMGTTGLIAQAMGRQDEVERWAIALRHLLLALGIGSLLVIAQVPLRQVGFTVLTAEPDVLQAGEAYFRALIWGAPANLMGFVLLGWFLGQAQGSRVLFFSLIGNGSNVILNYLFIVRWEGGAAGAGWATMLSQCLVAIAGLLLLLKEQPWRILTRARMREILRARSAWGQLLRLNGDILVRTFALLSVLAIHTNLSASFGTVILAANTLLMQVFSFSAHFIDGIAFAAESFAGQWYGAGETQRLRQLLQYGSLSSGVLGVGFAIAFILAPQWWLQPLTHHQAALAMASVYAPWLLLVLGLGSVAFLLDGYFLGLAAGRNLRNTTVQATLIFVPIALWAHYTQNAHYLWLGLSCFMLGRVLGLGVAIPSTLRQAKTQNAQPHLTSNHPQRERS